MTARSRDEVLEDIRTNPLDHVHVDLNSLESCCFIDEAVDLLLIDAHSEHAPLGRNGGVACDVLSGPCSCGAWH